MIRVIVQLDAEENYGEVHVEQVVQNSATPNKNGCYYFGQESPASFMSALQELGNRILSTSEDMEQRMADRFLEQIDRLDGKIWRLDNAGRAEQFARLRTGSSFRKFTRTRN